MIEEASCTPESAKTEFEKICEMHESIVDVDPDPDLVKLAESPPPNNTVHSYKNYDIKALKKMIKKHTEFKRERTTSDEGLKLLETELRFLERILFKNHNRFRNDRGYKALRILQKSVSKLLTNFPTNALNNLSTLMPIGLPYSDGNQTPSVLLPPTAIAQYAAVQLWIVHSLLGRIEFCCRNAGLYSLQRISLGHFWGVAAYQLSIVGRVWTLASNIKKHTAKLQSCIKEIAAGLPGKSLYTEENLKNIFNICPTETTLSSAASRKGSVQPDVQELSNLEMTKPVDLGVKVRREDYEKTAKSNPKVGKPEKKKKIAPPDLKFLSDLHSFDDLKQFIDSESLQRKTARKSAITRTLGQEEWKLLKKRILSEFNKKLPNKSIKKSRKQLKEALT